MTRQEQQALFAKNGFLVIQNILTSAELAECHGEIGRLHELAIDLEANGDPARSHFQHEPYARDRMHNDLPVLRKIENTRLHSEIFRNLAAHPPLIQTVQNLLGKDLLLFRSTLMLKPAHHGSAHALHQDSSYWPMKPPSLVTASIALNQATPENGCFKVIPGSHKWGLKEWGNIATQQDEAIAKREDIDLSGQIDISLEAGSALLFHSLLVHGSGPNRSPLPRNTALYAYFSPHVNYAPKAGAPREKSFPVVAGLDGALEHTLVARSVDST